MGNQEDRRRGSTQAALRQHCVQKFLPGVLEPQRGGGCGEPLNSSGKEMDVVLPMFGLSSPASEGLCTLHKCCFLG